MLHLGCHLTSSKGYEFMGRQALFMQVYHNPAFLRRDFTARVALPLIKMSDKILDIKIGLCYTIYDQ